MSQRPSSASHKKASRPKRASSPHAASKPVTIDRPTVVVGETALPDALLVKSPSKPPRSSKEAIPSVIKIPKPRPLAYSDIDVSQWRDYPDIQTDSLWMFSSRERGQGHQLDYHGNCIPQLLTQLISRYTKPEDIILDLFLGSGTTAIEAANLGRRAVGVELQPKMADYVRTKLQEQDKHERAIVVTGDSASPKTTPLIQQALGQLGQKNESLQAQFLFLHPPYADIIRFSELTGDLSTLESTEAFLDGFEVVCKQGYDLLEPGRFAAVVIGDKYANGELVPLGFYCMERMNRVGFRTKSIIVKNISGNEKAKGRMNNLWRYRALAGGFYVFKHEYVLVFEKPKKSKTKR